MNKVILSGTLKGEPRVSIHDGTAAGTALLRFTNLGGTIRLMAVGATAIRLGEFKEGDGVLVHGRLRAALDLLAEDLKPWHGFVLPSQLHKNRHATK